MIETDKTPSAAATDNQRGPRDLREWMDAIEADGSLLRVSAPINVQEELAAATYMVAQEENSPALLFENIEIWKFVLSLCRTGMVLVRHYEKTNAYAQKKFSEK